MVEYEASYEEFMTESSKIIPKKGKRQASQCLQDLSIVVPRNREFLWQQVAKLACQNAITLAEKNIEVAKQAMLNGGFVQEESLQCGLLTTSLALLTAARGMRKPFDVVRARSGLFPGPEEILQPSADVVAAVAFAPVHRHQDAVALA